MGSFVGIRLPWVALARVVLVWVVLERIRLPWTTLPWVASWALQLGQPKIVCYGNCRLTAVKNIFGIVKIRLPWAFEAISVGGDRLSDAESLLGIRKIHLPWAFTRYFLLGVTGCLMQKACLGS